MDPRRTLPAVAVGLAVLLGAGCASSPAAGPPATAAPSPPAPPAPPATRDLRELVLAAEAIPIPGFLPANFQPLNEDAISGISAFFETEDGSRQLGETIVLLPDPDAARTAMQGAVSTTQQQRTGATSAPAPVGDSGVIITGYRLAGVESTVLMFSQGAASVVMEFRSPDTDPIPAATVLEAGTRQSALLKPRYS